MSGGTRDFEDPALEAALVAALAVRDAPLGYAKRVAARAMAGGRTVARFLDPRWIFALGSGWAVAAALAGVVYADVLAQGDPDLLTIAEVALGTTQLLTGN